MTEARRKVRSVRIDWLAFFGLASGCVFAVLGAVRAPLWMFIAAAVLTVAAGVWSVVVGKEHSAPAVSERPSKAELVSPRVVAKGKRSIASWINSGMQSTGDRPEP
jgi:hypothetical protein